MTEGPLVPSPCFVHFFKCVAWPSSHRYHSPHQESYGYKVQTAQCKAACVLKGVNGCIPLSSLAVRPDLRRGWARWAWWHQQSSVPALVVLAPWRHRHALASWPLKSRILQTCSPMLPHPEEQKLRPPGICWNWGLGHPHGLTLNPLPTLKPTHLQRGRVHCSAWSAEDHTCGRE